MKKLLLLAILIFSFSLFIFVEKGFSDELDDINKQINDLTAALNMSIGATKPLEEQINSIRARVAFIEYDLAVKEKNIEEGYKNLEIQQKILNETIRDYYIKSYYNSPLLLLLSTDSVSDLTKILGYQKATADRDKAIITNIVLSISSLQQRKENLESEKKNIVVVKEKLDKIVTEAKAYLEHHKFL